LVKLIEVHGYAIVSRDDRIAGADGVMPDSLKNEADWAYFQAELALADMTLLGRASHEATPNLKRRRRVVVSRSARGLEARADAFWWNPLDMDWPQAAAILAPEGGRIAVPGGQVPFDLCLAEGFTAFHLSRASRALLPGGRGVFSACETGETAESLLAQAGLRPDPTQTIDEAEAVTLTVWRRRG
jgi:hypothetical protein